MKIEIVPPYYGNKYDKFIVEIPVIGKHKTNVFKEGNFTNVVYHSTKVVDFSNESIRLNSGGWRTVSTKDRMNQTSVQFNLGFRIFQDKFVWYVDFKGRKQRFYDHMILFR